MIFTNSNGGGIVRRNRFNEIWRPASERAGVESLRFHDLRHFDASLLINHGGSVKVVQARLGHASASETLATYAHLWPENEDPDPRRNRPGPRHQAGAAEQLMPELCRFHGPIITMYYGDHPPHCHVSYGRHNAQVLLDGTILAGALPRRQHRLVWRRAKLDQAELEETGTAPCADRRSVRSNPWHEDEALTHRPGHDGHERRGAPRARTR